MISPLYEINLKEVRENYDAGDSCMLEYLKDYITDDLMDLYIDVKNYNEIYANSWTIKDLFEMGKEDSYWTNRANSFIEKYDVPKEDYDNFDKYFFKYIELKNKLFDELGLSVYLDEDISIDKIPSTGFLESDIITNSKEMNDKDSYTVARVMNYGNSVELHYSEGKATIEYGYKITHDYWENEIEEIDWFNKDMSEAAINKKLYGLFEEHFGIQDEKKKIILEISKEYDVNFDTKIPFEYFDADSGNYNMSSFTEYYSDIFKRLKIHFDSMFTKEVSDGKYELILDNNILDLSAWDSLESVIDNVNSALEFYKNNDKGMEERMIEVEINNGGTLKLSQTEADKARNGIALEHIDDKGEIYSRDLISEGDFVTLMNYYCYVKDNDYKNAFINPNGLNEENSKDDEYEVM